MVKKLLLACLFVAMNGQLCKGMKDSEAQPYRDVLMNLFLDVDRQNHYGLTDKTSNPEKTSFLQLPIGTIKLVSFVKKIDIVDDFLKRAKGLFYDHEEFFFAQKWAHVEVIRYINSIDSDVLDPYDKKLLQKNMFCFVDSVLRVVYSQHPVNAYRNDRSHYAFTGSNIIPPGSKIEKIQGLTAIGVNWQL